jgi:hypothetical protein
MAMDRAECTSCRNFIRICYPLVQKPQLAKVLESNRAKKSEFLQALRQYEQNFEATGNNRGQGRNIDFPEIVTTEETAGRRSELTLGIFWPAPLYERLTGTSLAKEDREVFVHKGKKIVGIMREPSEGEPLGTIRVVDTEEHSVKKVVEVASSAKSFRDDEVREAHERLRTASASTVVAEVGDDGKHHVRIKRKSSGLPDSDDDVVTEWANLFAPRQGDVKGEQLDKSTRKKRKREKKGDSDCDSSVSALRPPKRNKGPTTTPSKSSTTAASPSGVVASISVRKKAVYPSDQQRQINDSRVRCAE